MTDTVAHKASSSMGVESFVVLETVSAQMALLLTDEADSEGEVLLSLLLALVESVGVATTVVADGLLFSVGREGVVSQLFVHGAVSQDVSVGLAP